MRLHHGEDEGRALPLADDLAPGRGGEGALATRLARVDANAKFQREEALAYGARSASLGCAGSRSPAIRSTFALLAEIASVSRRRWRPARTSIDAGVRIWCASAG